MDDEEEYYEDYIADQDSSFRSHTEITPDELTTAFHSLKLLRSEMYLSLQGIVRLFGCEQTSVVGPQFRLSALWHSQPKGRKHLILHDGRTWRIGGGV